MGGEETARAMVRAQLEAAEEAVCAAGGTAAGGP